MAAWRWETFREIADPYHCQSIGTSHTWRSILLPHPNSVPPSSTPPHHWPLTPSSPPPPKSRPQTAPQAPGASRESPAVRDLVSLTFARWQGARSHSGGGTLAAGLGPRTAAYTSPGHPGLGARSHASTVSSICQQLQIYLPDLPNTGSAGNISPITDCPGMPRKRSSVNQAERLKIS